jgi:hypothetical protein
MVRGAAEEVVVRRRCGCGSPWYRRALVAVAAAVVLAAVGCEGSSERAGGTTTTASAQPTPDGSAPASAPRGPAPPAGAHRGAGSPRPSSFSFASTVVDASLPGSLDNKAVGDLDGDGLPDIAVGTGSRLVWYRAPGWARSEIAAGHNFTTDMQAADVDGDGDTDLVTPHYDEGTVVWYRNPARGGGGWTPVEIGRPGTAHDVEVGDVDGDRRLDVVTRGHAGPTTLFRQSDPGSWQAVTISAAPSSEGTALGDLDRDGRLDIVQNGYWLAAPADVTAGHAWTRHTFAPGWDEGFVAVTVADLDRDGRLDIVQNGYWLAAPADVTAGHAWTRHTFAPGWDEGFVAVIVADLDRDGRLDVVLARSESEGRMAWYEAPPDPRSGGWVEHRIDDDVDFVHTFEVADMDGDGDDDVVFAEMQQSSRRRVGIFRNDGGGRAWSYVALSGGGSHNVRVADIGMDGDLDVVGANWQGGPVELWEQTGRPAG